MGSWTTRACVALAVLALCGCSASVKQMDSAPGYQANGHTYKDVSVVLTPEAKNELPENLKFVPAALQTMVQRALVARNLIAPQGDSRLQVKVKDIRVRSTFSAIMFGFMAGDDHIVGDVVVIDAAGRPAHTYEVSASYALGGLAGGQDSARMDWMYEKFAELTVKELTGEKSR